MNNKEFDEAENSSSQNSEDAVPNEASSIIKVEEKEAKFEDSHISDNFISETRSEGGIEDQHKLDELSEKEDPQIFEETKSKRSYDKRNKKKNKKKKWQKKKREAAKEEKKLAKRSKNSCDSDQSGLSSHKQTHGAGIGQKKQGKREEKNQYFEPNPSFNTENQSNLSEGKRNLKKKKGVHSTNPTSESSSFKGSSVISNQDAQLFKPTSKRHTLKEDLDLSNTTKNRKKSKKKKNAKTKQNMALKTTRANYCSESDQQDIDEENKSCNSKSISQSGSMWESDLIDSVFPSNPKKKSGKLKKKGKESKSANSPNTPEKKVEPKIESGKTSDVADSKMKKKEFKDKDTEEDKTEANSASLKQHNSLPVTRNIPQQENQPHQVSDFSTDYSPPQEQWKQNDHHYDTRKHNRKDRGSKNIPQEAVSSFYQCDEEYSEPKYFNDIEDYHRSNSYNYYQDSNEYIQNHQYVDNNIGYYQQDQTMMHSQVDPTAQRQFECEHFLYTTLSKEILAETYKITDQVNQITEYRNDIKQEIEQIALDTFSQRYSDVQAHIYGSVATGLALPESDMDIVITGVGVERDLSLHKSDLTLLYNQITERFSKKLIVKKLLITETTVPIIKLSFDLLEYYDEVVKDDSSRLPLVDFKSLDKNLKILAVDISMTCNANGTDHHGIKAAGFVQNCLMQFPILTPICLMLKKLLVRNGFNDPYTGGLGSFSLFLMLYAAYYIEKINACEGFHSEDTHPARLFAWFLTYFGDYFDIDKMAIIFMKEAIPLTMLKAYCGISEEGETRLCVLDPIALSTHSRLNNTTCKVWRILEIRSLFSETKKKIFKEYINIYNSSAFDEDLTILPNLM